MKIMMFYRHFPVAMGHYMKWGLEKAGHQVFSVGEFDGDKIPWGEQYRFPNYVFPPDLSINEYQAHLPTIYKAVLRSRFRPDVIVQMGDVRWLEGEVKVPQVIIATDPHAIDYRPAAAQAKLFVTMQNCYRYPEYAHKTEWIPYGFDPDIHFPEKQEPEYDIVFCGLQYTQRQQFLDAMKDRGYKVFSQLGVVYDEYRATYNKGKIAFNWSSKDDLPARFWEGMAMKRAVLTNIVPDMGDITAKEGEHYIGFRDLDEAIIKAKYYLEHEDKLKEIAENGYKWVQPHTWTARAELLIELIHEKLGI